MRYSLRAKSRQYGFTLIEMLVAIFILAILAAIAIPNLVHMQNKGMENAAAAELNYVIKAVTVYATEHEGLKPNVLADIDQYINGGIESLGWNYTLHSDGTVTQGDKK
jgi:prepilin-type N-terminal cleavage/methylation domain-containing protein